jgi:hypothetical protein
MLLQPAEQCLVLCHRYPTACKQLPAVLLVGYRTMSLSIHKGRLALPSRSDMMPITCHWPLQAPLPEALLQELLQEWLQQQLQVLLWLAAALSWPGQGVRCLLLCAVAAPSPRCSQGRPAPGRC